MNLAQFAVATMTLARSSEEERQMHDALLALKKTGLPVFVADGGSPAPFVEFLRESGFHVLQPTANGLVAQITLSLREAASRSAKPFLLYTEPDKAEFFRDHLPAFLEKAQQSEMFGCELVARTTQGFSTFPAMQQYAEKIINDLAADALGSQGDYTCGPFIFPSKWVSELANIPPEFGWGWRFYLFARLARKGLKITFQELPVSCPLSQRGENDPPSRLYRMKQLKQNIDGLLVGVA